MTTYSRGTTIMSTNSSQVASTSSRNFQRPKPMRLTSITEDEEFPQQNATGATISAIQYLKSPEFYKSPEYLEAYNRTFTPEVMRRCRYSDDGWDLRHRRYPGRTTNLKDIASRSRHCVKKCTTNIKNAVAYSRVRWMKPIPRWQ